MNAPNRAEAARNEETGCQQMEGKTGLRGTEYRIKPLYGVVRSYLTAVQIYYDYSEGVNPLQVKTGGRIFMIGIAISLFDSLLFIQNFTIIKTDPYKAIR